MDKLKPCPFCGSEAYIDAYCSMDDEWTCDVACIYCGANFILDDVATRKKAIAMQVAAWNRRAGDNDG